MFQCIHKKEINLHFVIMAESLLKQKKKQPIELQKRQQNIDSFLKKKSDIAGISTGVNNKPKEKTISSNVDTFLQSKSNEVFQLETNKLTVNFEGLNLNDYKQKCEASELKLKHATKVIKEMSKINLEKDLKIKMLENKLQEALKKDRLYASYEDRICPKDMEKLRAIKTGEKSDSTFILHLLRVLYGSRTAELLKKTSTGKAFKGQKKDPISPEKKQMMNEMISERILNEDSDDFERRIGKFSKHVKWGIDNINKVTKRDQLASKPKSIPNNERNDLGSIPYEPNGNLSPLPQNIPSAGISNWNYQGHI